ncbi:4-coumarate--CoA ligase-like 7 [Nylanderia fulva]|uniref:4-coumarate--CoA ligase-like 7 n=1 Tax=Nylanderia fulva TaxID=613905 RepID=UPI0010FB7ADA|nr:4-coumarate--CoA ligase-like 7 [Nylanderia fulva]
MADKILRQNQVVVPFNIKQKILKGEKTWNPYNKAHREYKGNIGNIILDMFESNPNFIGQEDAETGIQNTFQQMKERSLKCALEMKKLKIRRNDVIMICSHNQLDACIPFLASLYLGAVVNPLDEHFFKGNSVYYLEQSKPKMIFIDEKYSTIIHSIYETSHKNLPQIIFFNADQDSSLSLKSIINKSYDPSEIENFRCSMVETKETAMKLFTPGTTALPKNVDIPCSAFMGLDQYELDWHLNDVALWFDSLGFINGAFMTIQAILLNVKVIKIKSNFDTKTLCQLIELYKVTWMFLETSMCIQLIKSNNLTKYDVSSLRTIVYSGSTLNSKFIDEDLKLLLPKTIIIQAYSLTETGIIACQRQNRLIDNGSNGNVNKNVRLKIVSLKNGKSLGPYEEGEIYCQSPFMMIRQNNEPITCDGKNSNWFRTGDMGYYDSNNEIYITDRINQMFDKTHTISPAYIESFLQDCLGVSEAVIIPVPCNPNHAIAFVTPTKKITEKKLKQSIVNDLRDKFKLCADVIFLSQFPRIPNGKIHRKLLHDWAQTNICA